jgi:flagellar biosynthesis chaperone FliJ
MNVKTERQLLNARRKLAELEAEYQQLSQQKVEENARRPRQLTLRSMGSLIKQLKEEIACYESRKTHSAG